MTLAKVLILAFCCQGLGFAQTKPKPLEFEVASVKQVAPPEPGKQAGPGGSRSTGFGSMDEAGDRISYQGVTLKRMLLKAYGLQAYQILGPRWIESEHYDVVAKIPEGTSKDEVPEMLQNLLTERFRIALHSDIKVQPVLLLRVGRDGAKLKPATNDHHGAAGGFSTREGGQAEMYYWGITMPAFAETLSRQLSSPVIDETGLDGKFDITLLVDAEDLRPGAESLPSSLLTAVRGIGLKLEPGKSPIKHLVIDEAQKVPLEN